MADLVAELQQLIGELPKDVPGGSIEMLLRQMDGPSARLLRLCAIPHQFTPPIVQTLMPALDAGEAQQQYAKFSGLPVLVLRDKECAIHDEARAYLFRQWLEGAPPEEFASASRRLAAYFGDCAARTTGEHRDSMQRQRMFHTFAFDQEAGFAEFEQLWSEQYGQFRLSGCKILLKLLQEYEPVLPPARRARLAYFEAMLAADLFQTDEAETLLKAILGGADAAADPALQIRSLVRLARLARTKKDWQAAIGYLREALERSRQTGSGAEMHPILLELGVAHRETGDLEQAEAFLQQSLAEAEQKGDQPFMATVYNGLGTLYARNGDSRGAVQFYEKALRQLREAGDRFRSAQVYNNLGVAHAKLGEWDCSRHYYEQSLKGKEEAGDTLGQAMTLNNLVHIHQNQGRNSEALALGQRAAELFLQVRDLYNAALAKSNLGRLYRKIGEAQSSARAFGEAAALFEQCNKPGQAEAVRKDMALATAKLPWWIWAPFTLAAFVLLFILAAVVAVLRR